MTMTPRSESVESSAGSSTNVEKHRESHSPPSGQGQLEKNSETRPLSIELQDELCIVNDSDNPTVRLLQIHPGKASDPLACSLSVVSLDESPVFEIITYANGTFEGKSKADISLNGRISPIDSELDHFLKKLRRPSESSTVWVKQICLNTHSRDEAGHHSHLYDRMLRDARKTHIWLGNLHPSWEQDIKLHNPGYFVNSELNSNQLRSLELGYTACIMSMYHNMNPSQPPPTVNSPHQSLLRHKDPLLQVGEFLEAAADNAHMTNMPFYHVERDAKISPRLHWEMRWFIVLDCLRWLLSRSYWTEVGTLQELVLTRRVHLIRAGSMVIPVGIFFRALHNLSQHSSGCCHLITREWYDREGNRTMVYFNLFSKFWNARIAWHADRRIPLLRVLYSNIRSSAIDIRDHVYQTLGLITPGMAATFKCAPYQQAPAAVFGHAAKLIFVEEGFFPSMSHKPNTIWNYESPLPTWAFDMSRVSSHLMCLTWARFRASGGTRPEVSTLSLADGRTFTIRVARIGTIMLSATGQAAPAHNEATSVAELVQIVIEWQKLYRSINPMGTMHSFFKAITMDKDDAVLRSVLKSRGGPEIVPKLLFASITGWRAASTDQPGSDGMEGQLEKSDLREDSTGPSSDASGIDAHLAHDLDDDSGEEVSDLARELYLGLERATIENVRMASFFVTDRGEPMLGSKYAKIGDPIFVLNGGKAPAVLRKIDDCGKICGKQHHNDCQEYIYVGHCFVEVWMFGKADEENLEWKTFRLH